MSHHVTFGREGKLNSSGLETSVLCSSNATRLRASKAVSPDLVGPATL